VAARATAILDRDGWPALLADVQNGILAFWSALAPPDRGWPVDLSTAWPSLAARDAHVADHDVAALIEEDRVASRAAHDAYDALLRQRNGLVVDLTDNPSAYRQARQRGLRVDETLRPAEDLALVRASGRNPDGSVFGYVECWGRGEDVWKQHIVCLDEDLAHLPPTWPLPLTDASAMRRDEARALARSLAGIPRPKQEMQETAPPAASAVDLSLTSGR
jgi:hypothetical protein